MVRKKLRVTVARVRRKARKRRTAATMPVRREATRQRRSRRNSYQQDKTLFNTVCAFGTPLAMIQGYPSGQQVHFVDFDMVQ